jgi:hypothetical protein
MAVRQMNATAVMAIKKTQVIFGLFSIKALLLIQSNIFQADIAGGVKNPNP